MRHLQTRPQFQAVLAGRVVSRTPHFVLHVLEDRADDRATGTGPVLFPLADTSLGAMVPKRWARRAVTRNAIKRQIFTVSKEFEPDLTAVAYVVRLRSTFDRAKFVSATSQALKLAVRSELQQLFSCRETP